MNAYDKDFFEWVNLTARRSALALLPLVREDVQASSLLDVGCGQGAWLAVWRELGIEHVIGLDGSHVRADALLIPAEQFKAADLSKP